jgi:homocysteine S-methyltransferase
VAASLGPYGAFLADGSEYRGDYGLEEEALYDFHARRWHLLSRSRADLLACETIPSGVEAAALLRLLDETPGRWAWLSFTLRDPEHLSDGTGLAPLLERLERERPEAFARLAAVGVNCVSPALADAALPVLAAATDRPICLYPNSGEGWDAADHRWTGAAEEWIERSPEWRRRGARVIGGCCRTSPSDVRRLREVLLGAL